MPVNLLDPQVPPQSLLLLQGGAPGHQGRRHGLRVPSPRAGPGHITEAPEVAPPYSPGLLGPGSRPRLRLLLRPPGSALPQFLLLGPGPLLEESPLLLLLPPAEAAALSLGGPAGSLRLALLLLALLGMLPGQAI